MKQYRHEVTIVIRADKKCSKAQAVAAVKDCIHGTFYPYEPDAGHGEFKIAAVKSRPAKRKLKWMT